MNDVKLSAREIEVTESVIGSRVAITVKGTADYYEAFAAARMLAYVSGRTIQSYRYANGKKAPSGVVVSYGVGHPGEKPYFRGYRFFVRPAQGDAVKAA